MFCFNLVLLPEFCCYCVLGVCVSLRVGLLKVDLLCSFAVVSALCFVVFWCFDLGW